MSKPLLITVKNLSKVYAGEDSGIQTKALDDVSFNVEEGDFFVIAGPSGSGKTTLLNILAGLDEPTSGEALFEKASLAALNPGQAAALRLKRIGFLFASHNLIETFTILENTEYVALLQGMPRKRRHKPIF